MKSFVSILALLVSIWATGCSERHAGIPHAVNVLQDLPERPDAPDAERAMLELAEKYDFDFDTANIKSETHEIDSRIFVVIVDHNVVFQIMYFLVETEVESEWVAVSKKIEL